MGPLTLAAQGPVYLDTNCFIYSVERIEPFRTLLEPIWHEARDGRFEIISSEIIVAETLVKPLREGDKVVETLQPTARFASPMTPTFAGFRGCLPPSWLTFSENSFKVWSRPPPSPHPRRMGSG